MAKEENTNSGKGLTGLLNLGNSCYLNSALQIIGNFHDLNDYIETYLNDNSDINNLDLHFMKEWNALRLLMWSKNVIISPNRFKKTIEYVSEKKNWVSFAGFEQNDANEFLFFVMNIFHDSLKMEKSDKRLMKLFLSNEQIFLRKKYKDFNKFINSAHNEYSYIDYLFTIYFKIEYVDKETNEIITTNYENAYSIDLPLNKLSICDCLQDLFEPEELNKQNNNQYYDDKEDRYKDVIKKTYVFQTSKYLIVQLKRWNMNLRKNQRIIHYDIDKPLVLSKYCFEDLITIGVSKSYELFGVINHSGNIYGGHYTCAIKNDNSKWYDYNDAMVKEISANKVIGNKNYCLIYRLK
uniref:USP domain-containing protein n=1 Tax=viral metagenome TaxID=1070528 RepID=A0A6C0KZ67_9ZZZZ|tara:strand:+ start:17218 stop:18270 length:1053 start_codon:yes stop_codon:yes gene_type:complete